jgi:hypothetical protein
MVTGTAALACLTLLGSAVIAKAMAIRPGNFKVPVQQRVAQADCIVVGKITAIADKTVNALQYPGAQQKGEFKVATLKISKVLTGVKGLTEIKVGYAAPIKVLPQPGGGPGGVRPGGGIRPPIGRPIMQQTLSVGQEGLWFLAKHFDGDFYVVSGYPMAPVDKKDKDFDKDVKLTQHCLKLLAKPMTGLKAKDQSERLLTTSLLLDRYRTVKQGMKFPYKTKPINKEESKLILKNIAESDWSKPEEKHKISGNALFYRIGLQPTDGWTQPKFAPGQNYVQVLQDAFKEWLKDKGKDYQIQRYVAEKADKTEKKETKGK